MKLSELKINVPTIKPRNSTYRVLGNKVNAAGPHRDKKSELKKGLIKHKNPRHLQHMHEDITIEGEI